ncbi:37S ribosomal protein S9 [Ophiocordyceps camponoti-floridani]|uniref:Small ribosomal subunit protein uS9m n=1 Tax=Ophiocordyceps camponoti-floridani TaxID=2030778 RepID=A0A8H4VCD9_9HYPO|nr:37S ribosomal protein S9 [Ophiocordyceps camponoti-floridani]
MASIGNALRRLKSRRQLTSFLWHHQIGWRRANLLGVRKQSTNAEVDQPRERDLRLQEIKIPFEGVTWARAVPVLSSYFSREPRLNLLQIRLTKLLLKYNSLPVLNLEEEAPAPWATVDEMRVRLGEHFKRSNFAKVMKLAKRLQSILPSLVPAEVKLTLQGMMRDRDPLKQIKNPKSIDQFGRAVGVGKRKESTARAFVVEGTGEVLINGKTLSETFNRVHDRESAVWALTVTNRLDKYNVWALVEGGGTTGRAEAITLAVARALVMHEPALKSALRKAGCITRDRRTVERKKPGHVKARKMPAWVKR